MSKQTSFPLITIIVCSIFMSCKKQENSGELLKIGTVPKFELLNQNNEFITNKSLLGKVYVLEFFFSTCPSICPKMNKNMLILEKYFLKNPEFGIISITINPEFDTPKILKLHAKALGVQSSNWFFLTGDKETILKLSNSGFNIYAGENNKKLGNFEHSGLFALIDKKGFIRSRKDTSGNPITYYNGLEDTDIQYLKEDISNLLMEK